MDISHRGAFEESFRGVSGEEEVSRMLEDDDGKVGAGEILRPFGMYPWR